jgi:DNA-binding protein Fis
MQVVMNNIKEDVISNKFMKVTEDVNSYVAGERLSSNYKTCVKLIEKTLIEESLLKTRGNQLRAAKLLGINRNTLHSKIIKCGIDINQFK